MTRTPRKPTDAAPRASTPARAVSTPVLGCLMVATLAFGGARIHAETAEGATGVSSAGQNLTARLVDFAPTAFQPSAFADWQEQQPQRNGEH